MYVGAAKGGLALAYTHDQVTAVWPPSGIALAAVFLWGYRVWPGVMLGAFLVNAWTGAPFLTDVGIAVGNTLEGLVGAALLRRAGFRPTLARVRDVVALAVLAAGLSTMVSATVGTASLWFGDVISSGDLASAWRVWWLGDAGGDLLVAPVLMLAVAHARVGGLRRSRVVEAACLVVVLLGSSVVALTSPGRVYVVFPALIWAAVRFRQPGATAASLVVAGLALWFTAHRTGPFVTDSPDDSLLLSQSFVGVVNMTALVLAAVTTVRDHGERSLRQREARRTAIVDAALDCVITTDDHGRIIEFNPAAERTFGYTLGEVYGRDVADVIIPPRLRARHRSLGHASEILLTGRLIDAEEAHRLGIVNRIVPADSLLDATFELAGEIAANSPFGIRLTKEILQTNVDAPSLEAAIALENRSQVLASRTRDMSEALAAFREKRPPKFENR